MPGKAARNPTGEARVRIWYRRFRSMKPAGITLLLLFAMSLAAAATLRQVYAGRVYPGVELGAMEVSGMTSAAAAAELTKYADTLALKGVTFTFQDHTFSISPVVVPRGELDSAYELFAVDVKRSVDAALAVGRTGSVLGQHIDVARSLTARTNVPVQYTFDREGLLGILEQEFREEITPARDAEFVLHENGVLTILPDVDGVSLNFHTVLDQLEQELAGGRIPESFRLERITTRAAVQEGDLLPALPLVHEVLDRGPVRLIGPEGQRWEYGTKDIASFLSVGADGELTLHFSNTKAALDRIGDEVVVQPKSGKFERVGEKVQEFQVAEDGRKLNSEATREVLAELLFTEKTEAPIALTVLEPEVNAEEIADLGLTDLIGVGRSNFAGSPVNRRHNIAIGAAAVHGTLIAPGEEFSLLRVLGEIDGSNGYRQELVIKGNKTIPEYGGGLCQIGTTTFRAALDAGFPITARRNHSYAVSYYNDENGLPGTDATIYDPAPDFRFVNDTGHYALFQTRIEGDELIFEVWGTDDGRKVTRSKPRVYNRVAPPPTKYVETTDLAPGEEKCTERAHAGMDAEFTYTVTYPNGEVKEEIFKSHYRPWQAVCLRGVDPSALPEARQEG